MSRKSMLVLQYNKVTHAPIIVTTPSRASNVAKTKKQRPFQTIAFMTQFITIIY